MDPNDGVTTRLEAVLSHVQTALTYGRNLKGSYYPNLFVDGINVDTKEPVTWVYKNTTYYPTNFLAQQSLMKMLDGLTVLSGDRKYREIAYDQYRFWFENLTDSNGLLYAGPHVIVDVMTGNIYKEEHEVKDNQLPYELMWAADPVGTKRYIEALWNAHVWDMTSVNMNRHGKYNLPMGELWNSAYLDDSPYVLARLNEVAFTCTANDLMEAAYFLSSKTGDPAPRLWADRMLEKLIAVQDDNTGLAGGQYGLATGSDGQVQDRFNTMFNEGSTYKKYNETQWINRDTVKTTTGFGPQSLLPEYEETGNQKIYDYITNNMSGVAEYIYLPETHQFNTPILSDGTDLGGVKPDISGYYGSAEKAFPEAQSTFGLVLKSAVEVYAAMQEKGEADPAVWEMARAYAKNAGFGEIGSDLGADDVAVNLQTTNANCWEALAAVSLYRLTGNQQFYDLACRLGDNLVSAFFHNGMFTTGTNRANAKFDSENGYAVLVIEAMAAGVLDKLADDNLSGSVIDLIYDGVGRTQDGAVLYGYDKVPVESVTIDRESVSLNAESGRITLYSDIAGHWTESEIKQLASLGIFEEEAGSKFYPEEKITRAEFVKLIVKLCGFQNSSKPAAMYSDVPEDHPYYAYIASAKNAGILSSGLAGTTFQGDKILTKEEMASILVNALKKANPGKTYYTGNSLYEFADKDKISGWAYDYVDIAYNYDIIDGVTARELNPQAAVTRSYAAFALKNLLNEMENEDIVQLSAKVMPVKADDDVITWTTGNSDIVEVDERGRIYPISAGETIITATADGVSDSILVSVASSEDWMIRKVYIEGKKYQLFEPGKKEYRVELPLGTTVIPGITAESFTGAAVKVTLPAALPGYAVLSVEGSGQEYRIYFDPCAVEYIIKEDYDRFKTGTLLTATDDDTENYSWEIFWNANKYTIVERPDRPGSGDQCIRIRNSVNWKISNVQLSFPRKAYTVGENADDMLIVFDFDTMAASGGEHFNNGIRIGSKNISNYKEWFNAMVWEKSTGRVYNNKTGQEVLPAGSFDRFDNVKIVINKKTYTADYYVNGKLKIKDLKMTWQDNADINKGPDTIGCLVLFGSEWIPNNYDWYLDNLKIYQVTKEGLEESFIEDYMVQDIQLDGESLADFRTSQLNYCVELPIGTTDVPVITATGYDKNAEVKVTAPASLPGTATIQVGDSAKVYEIYMDPCLAEGPKYVINEDYNSFAEGTLLTNTDGDESRYKWVINQYYHPDQYTIVERPDKVGSGDMCIHIHETQGDNSDASLKVGDAHLNFPNMAYTVGSEADDKLIVFSVDTYQATGSNMNYGGFRYGCSNTAKYQSWYDVGRYDANGRAFVQWNNKEIVPTGTFDTFTNIKWVVNKKTLQFDIYVDGVRKHENVALPSDTTNGLSDPNAYAEKYGNIGTFILYSPDWLNYGFDWYLDNIQIYEVNPEGLADSFVNNSNNG